MAKLTPDTSNPIRLATISPKRQICLVRLGNYYSSLAMIIDVFHNSVLDSFVVHNAHILEKRRVWDWSHRRAIKQCECWKESFLVWHNVQNHKIKLKNKILSQTEYHGWYVISVWDLLTCLLFIQCEVFNNRQPDENANSRWE